MTRHRVDRGELLRKISALAGQCQQGWEMGLRWSLPSRWADSENLLVLGMGGSAIGADLVQGILQDRIPHPIAVNRTYTIPAWVDRRTLVLACSYSGNTEETLAAVKEAVRRGARLAAITSGGRLAVFARRNKFPLLRIPQGLPPRAALGYLAFAPLGLCVRLGWAAKRDLRVEAACASLKRFIQQRLGPSIGSSSNPAKKLARRLKGRLPVLYGASGGWEAVTYRWRTQLEENAKALAFHHLFPEATHNEISGWVHPPALIKKMTALFLMDPSIHPRVWRRMEFTRRIILSQGAQALKIQVAGASFLERMLKMIALGDFTSVYLALLYRTDPTPVERIEALKKWLR
ncbi:MAG: bifunctional phosphoglucose/phosphomannose isomerase [Candidatus Omnitrophica bacterium]|nr:bifunctional phosphoglucose/phosphomannose isomerase [Candidatus Omnitrophota bacterium]